MRTVWVSSMTSRLPRHGTYVLDCDGTVYVGDQAVPGAVGPVRALRWRRSETLFLTTNPLRSRAEYAQFLTSLGMPTEPADVVTSIDALIDYLSLVPGVGSLLVLGEPLLELALAGAGSRGFDAVTSGAQIVVTNPDQCCPTTEGALPDCAAMLAALWSQHRSDSERDRRTTLSSCGPHSSQAAQRFPRPMHPGRGSRTSGLRGRGGYL
jgi:ribonucleotide monophosphatase NagD (HAD superfamily)